MQLVNRTDKFFLLITVLILFRSLTLFSQTKIELEKRKADNINQLEYTRDILNKMGKSRKTSLNEISLIEKSISVRENLVDNISEEIQMLEKDISNNNEEITRINARIEDIKKEYAELIRNSYKLLDKEYSLMYILAAEDMNQGYMRIKYIRHLSDYRKRLINSLDAEKDNIIILNKDLSANKIKNEKLLNERKSEIGRLDKDRKHRLVVVRDLRNKESELKKEIQRREKVMVQIEQEMKRILEEEAKKVRTSKSVNKLTAQETVLASEFSSNKGKLPWPTEKGIITVKFGKQNHAILKGIEFESRGVDITTANGSKARAIFDGEVTKVIAIMGANYTIIIRHGNYYTVYQNIVNVRVKAGDKVKTGEDIGTVFTDMDNISKIHFEIWQEKSLLNPELWLKM